MRVIKIFLSGSSQVWAKDKLNEGANVEFNIAQRFKGSRVANVKLAG